MPLFEENEEDRTESATPHRREEFRKQGTVALSRDLLGVAVMLAVGLAIAMFVGQALPLFTKLFQTFFDFSSVKEIGKVELWGMSKSAFGAWTTLTAPLFIAAILVGIGVGAAQVGFYFTWEPLVPNLERLSPLNGLRRMFSGQGAMEALKAVLKLVLAALVVWIFIKAQLGNLPGYFKETPAEGTLLMMKAIAKLFFGLCFALLFIGGLDYAYQKLRLEKKMRMTRREAREEFKLREGDPLVKSRIRTIQRKFASRRMMEAVPKADVVVTNPTHFAVALKYEAGKMAAPKVTAKGAGATALKIKELAKQSSVPVMENKPLARALFKEVEIGQTISRELYKAVAEVLAYVYRVKRGMNG